VASKRCVKNFRTQQPPLMALFISMLGKEVGVDPTRLAILAMIFPTMSLCGLVA
jgi:hypothetical protein